MDVYLTFDDGIQAGTEEVLEVLKDTGVKATFFLIGNELYYSYKKNQRKTLALLQHMRESHDIGLHSYSHANFYYSDYYLNNGVQIDRDGTLRSIVADFKKGEDLITEFLKTGSESSYRDKRFSLARLPGRNTFCFSTPNNGPRDFSKSICHFEEGTEKCARELYDAGYNIFGWNVEWKMSFEFNKEAVEQKKLLENTTGIDYRINENIYPDIDMYFPDNASKDRLTEGWMDVLNKIKMISRRREKVILLMHDRAFRKGAKDGAGNFDPNDGREAEKLRSLIEQLKMMHVCFKELSEFSY